MKIMESKKINAVITHYKMAEFDGEVTKFAVVNTGDDRFISITLNYKPFGGDTQSIYTNLDELETLIKSIKETK